ncbi:MAG: hypothetical protein P8P29_00970 [Flavobacteriaceae bacterium]|nr:hypothetical protein [Flavobacteriaceae bacterium]
MTSGSITEFGTERTIEQRANMQQVIDWLAKGAPHTVLKDGSSLDGFHYSNYIVPSDDIDATTGQCGTVSCIAGAAVQFDSPVPMFDGALGIDFVVDDKAQRLLGLSYREAQLLFYPFNLDLKELEDIYSVDGLTLGGRLCTGPLELGFDDMLEAYFCGVAVSEMPLAELEFAEPRQIARVLQHFQDTGVIDWYILQS